MTHGTLNCSGTRHGVNEYSTLAVALGHSYHRVGLLQLWLWRTPRAVPVACPGPLDSHGRSEEIVADWRKVDKVLAAQVAFWVIFIVLVFYFV